MGPSAMSFGTILLGGADFDELRRRAALAEALGYDMVGVGDVPMHYRELYVCLSVLALATSRVRIGPLVTNPVTRHPGVTAAAAAALDELSCGRVVLGMGAGGGPLLSLGMAIPRLDTIRASVVTVRRLLAGEPSEWEGRPLTFGSIRKVPVYLAAYGPRTAELAGEVADGLIFAGGASPEAVAAAGRAVATGARRAGRDPGDVDLWVMTRASVAASKGESIAGIKANLASAGSHGLRSPGQLETVPAHLREGVHQLQARYDQSEHVRWDGANARLIDELGLTDFLADRFAIAGTPEDVRRRTTELGELGVTRIIVPAVDREPETFLSSFADALGLSPTADRTKIDA